MLGHLLQSVQLLHGSFVCMIWHLCNSKKHKKIFNDKDAVENLHSTGGNGRVVLKEYEH